MNENIEVTLARNKIRAGLKAMSNSELLLMFESRIREGYASYDWKLQSIEAEIKARMIPDLQRCLIQHSQKLSQ